MQNNTKRLTTLAMLAALAIVAMLTIRIQIFAEFLTYDPKDVIIIIGGFLFGPIAVLPIIVVAALIEMTISGTAHWGLLMNISSSAAFVIPAVMIYRHWRNLPSAVIGLIIGAITVTGVMLLLNYLIVPLYTGAPRAVVVSMLVPVILPFNLVKSALNAAIVMMLYKSVSVALTKAGLYQPASAGKPSKVNKWVMIISGLTILALVIIILTKGAV